MSYLKAELFSCQNGNYHLSKIYRWFPVYSNPKGKISRELGLCY
jgi:hypothetical protein